MNTELKSLKFDNVEETWNNFGKLVCEVTDVVLGKKIRNTARNFSENALCLIERRGLYTNYLSDRLYENKRNVRKVEKALNVN